MFLLSKAAEPLGSLGKKAINFFSDSEIAGRAQGHYGRVQFVLNDLSEVLSGIATFNSRDLHQHYFQKLRGGIGVFVMHMEHLMAFVEYRSEQCSLLQSTKVFIVGQSNSLCQALEGFDLENGAAVPELINQIRRLKESLEREYLWIFDDVLSVKE